MNGSEPDVSLEDYVQYLSGYADDETHARVCAALDDPESELSDFVGAIRDDDQSFLTSALKARFIRSFGAMGHNASQDLHWIDVWERTHNRPALPLPSPEERACLAALAPKTCIDIQPVVPIRAMFRDVHDRSAITDIVSLQRIAERAVDNGLLKPHECKLDVGEQSEEFALRGESPGGSQTEQGYQLAYPPEELLAGICRSLLDAGNLTEEIKQDLLNLADSLHFSDGLRKSFEEWLIEL